MISKLYEIVVVGLILGSMYGLTSLGVNIIFGVMGIVNWAHGSILMLSMYIVWGCVTFLGFNPYLSIIIAAPVMFAFGYIFQHTILRPLYLRERHDSNPMGLLFCTAGLGIALQNLALVFLRSTPRSIKTSLSMKYVDLGFGASISLTRVIGAVIALVVTGIIWFYIDRTYSGRSLRATSQDREAAGLMGINVLKTYNIAFGLGCAICAAAGVVFSTFYSITPTAGATIGNKAFIILVLGGIGSIPGTFVAGLIIGLIETAGIMFFNSFIADTLCFAVFVLVLLLRPSGLFGKKVVQ